MQAHSARKRPRPSLTSHHLFPPIVALWFGALFSLSTLAVRTGLFEAMVVACGVDRLVPAASPPLGHTARLLIAVVFGLLGAALGGLIARLVAGARDLQRHGDFVYPPPAAAEADYRVRARDAHPDAPARRPISAHAELGGESLLAPVTPGEFVVGPRIFEPDAAELPVPPLPQWLMRDDAEDDAAAIAAPALVPEPVPAPAETSPPEASPPEASPVPESADPAFPQAWRNTAERIALAPPSNLSHVELIERLAIAMHKREGGNVPDPTATPAPSSEETKSPAPDQAATIQALRDALANLREG